MDTRDNVYGTADKGDPSETEIITWIIVYISEAVVIIIANILSLAIFLKKFRGCKIYILLMNLSFADLLVGCCVCRIAVGFVYEIPENKEGCLSPFDTFYLAFSSLAVTESIATLALIALERAYAVIKPIQHRVLKTKYYRYAIMLSWCLSASPSICAIVLQCAHENLRLKAIYGFDLAIVISSLLTMIVSYTAIYIKIRFFPVFQHNASTQMQMKLCKTLFSATFASVLAMIPFGAVQSYSSTCPSCVSYPNLTRAAIFLVFSNSFVNLLIYAWKMPEFGKELKQALCFCQKMNTQNEVAAARNTQERHNDANNSST